MSIVRRKYSIIPGFFLQDDPHHAVPEVIGAIPPRFGLRDESPDRWIEFKAQIAEMNESAPEGTTYKVFFLGRHGQGFHNVAEAKYGSKAWDDYWSKLNGDGEIVWGPDPLLTAVGISQAETARTAWLTEIPYGIPVPEQCYASPLHRALSTWETTFCDEGILGNERKVLILENLREENGVHTCDKRNPLSTIQKNFPPPIYSFEPGFTEEDLLWHPNVRETRQQVKNRATQVLDKIFDESNKCYISITAHGGIINGFLGVMGRRPYGLPTGGVLPLVVKGEILAAS